MSAQKDVKKMLLQRTRTDNWSKWAAKHEIEGVKEGTWLELERRRMETGLKTGSGRRLGAEDILRHRLVGRK